MIRKPNTLLEKNSTPLDSKNLVRSHKQEKLRKLRVKMKAKLKAKRYMNEIENKLLLQWASVVCNGKLSLMDFWCEKWPVSEWLLKNKKKLCKIL